MTESDLDAPIIAATVFPDRARVTRRGRRRLSPGEHRVVIDHLPLSLRADSVRVVGTGPATIVGVDVARRRRPRTGDEVVRHLEEQLRQARAALAVLDDEDRVASGRLEFLTALARRAARSYAKALASGESDPVRVVELSDALGAQQALVHQQRRALAERRERAREEVAAHERSLAARKEQREPDHNAVTVALDASAEGDIELELSYVVDRASWTSTYDLRLDGDTLVLTWFGLVTQHTGEDWPECDLRLSTARPSDAATVPELDPWFLDRARPMPPPAPMVTRGMPLAFGAEAEEKDYEAALTDVVATLEQGPAAATYRPARPVAVPADGAAHRASLAVLELAAERDYITAPVKAAEAHLRAKLTNTSTDTLPAGTAAVFHGGDFVATTALKVWAPGEEMELALGVDDRIRVERELVRRGATKAVLGATRRHDAEHRITVTNHTPARARVSVLDQLPVSRDQAIVVKEQRLEPAPDERTDMGVLTWVLDLAPGESKDIHLGVRVEAARGVEIVGWRE